MIVCQLLPRFLLLVAVLWTNLVLLLQLLFHKITFKPLLFSQGVIQGIHLTTVQQLFAFVQPIMGSLVDLLGLFHNYPTVVELILEFFCEAAKRCLCYLNHSDSRILYQHSVNIIRMYAHHNQGKRSVEKEAEEEQFRDILLLMELLTNLLSKDFIDLAPQGIYFPPFCYLLVWTIKTENITTHICLELCIHLLQYDASKVNRTTAGTSANLYRCTLVKAKLRSSKRVFNIGP